MTFQMQTYTVAFDPKPGQEPINACTYSTAELVAGDFGIDADEIIKVCFDGGGELVHKDGYDNTIRITCNRGPTDRICPVPLLKIITADFRKATDEEWTKYQPGVHDSYQVYIAFISYEGVDYVITATEDEDGLRIVVEDTDTNWWIYEMDQADHIGFGEDPIGCPV